MTLQERQATIKKAAEYQRRQAEPPSKKRHVLELFDGDFIDYCEPAPEHIHVEDIARALAFTCRFGGHVSTYYSVAEHAVLVSNLVQKAGGTWIETLAALHHDSHEAYIGDLPTPLKNVIGAPYRKMVGQFDHSIAMALSIRPSSLLHTETVKWADAAALRLEAYKLKVSRGFHEEWNKSWKEWGLEKVPHSLAKDWRPGFTPLEAERAFLARHRELAG